MKNVVYIAGKMRGLPDLGRGQFNAVEERLRAKGYKVLNPARLPDDLPEECYMPICLAMLDQADTIALLPTWEDSNGAKIEVAYGAETGKVVLYFSDLQTLEAEA